MDESVHETIVLAGQTADPEIRKCVWRVATERGVLREDLIDPPRPGGVVDLVGHSVLGILGTRHQVDELTIAENQLLSGKVLNSPGVVLAR